MPAKPLSVIESLKDVGEVLVRRPLLQRLSALRAKLSTLTGLRPSGFFVQYDYAASLSSEIPPYPAIEELFRDCHAEIEEFINAMADDLPEFEQIRAEGELDWESRMFSPLDTMAAYTMVRRLEPARILEIGCGTSTRILARALADAGRGRLTCIDPAPRRSIGDLNVDFCQRSLAIEDVERLDRFEPGDVLFIDSSHIMLPGMDVDIQFNRMFPRLNPGVVVHVHDIFLPDNYPPEWRSRYYSEQNALVGWIFSGYFDVLWPAYYAITRHRDAIQSQLSTFGPVRRDSTAGSLWLRRTAVDSHSKCDTGYVRGRHGNEIRSPHA